MPNVVVVGAQWGDEGKGKIVDVLSEYADIVVRFSGGANAGHTLVVNGQRVVLHLIPSGALHPDKRCALGDGMVIDLQTLLEEIRALRAMGLLSGDNQLLVSERAHLILPYHRGLDEARERGADAIGTTRRGIGPAYEDKYGRRGVRVGDLLITDRFRQRVRAAVEDANVRLQHAGAPTFSADKVADDALRLVDQVAPFVCDVSRELERAMARGESLLLEGAQGSLLDVDHGTYPFVTSTTTTAAGAGSGAGIGPTAIDSVTGVTKSYTTRVGSGPFPTELPEPQAGRLREAGSEYGATTGRPRRCGWLDVAALRLAKRINGLRSLCITKLDVLRGLGPIQFCSGYRVGERLLDEMPLEPDDLSRAVPIFESVAGFDEDCATARSVDELPVGARQLCETVAKSVGVSIDLISVGAGREQTIWAGNPFRAGKRRQKSPAKSPAKAHRR
jgi:adenylosuccinate synthase